MLQLANHCTCSTPQVHPKNWNTPQANTKSKWYIHYRFYDPSQKEKFPKGRQIVLKGMNRFTKTLDRKAATKGLLDEELYLLEYQHYNHISQSFYVPENHDITPYTPFIKALELANERMICVKEMKADVESCIRYINKAAQKLNFANLPIGKVTRKYIKLILDECFIINEKFTNNRFNKYRDYLIKMYNELIQLEAVEYNAPKEIIKLPTVAMMRETLTPDERKKVDQHLYKNFRDFWRFMHIFYHSGGRISELMRLKVKDVNMVTQKYKCVIMKGKKQREVFKTIKDIAMPFWEDQLQNANETDFVFSKGLEPGPTQISKTQINRRWKRNVKDVLGITGDFYSLKHLHTDEMVELLGLKDAAAHNGHTTTRMTAQVYAINEKERQHIRLKEVGNSFV